MVAEHLTISIVRPRPPYRDDARLRQKDHRRDLTDHARSLALGAEGDDATEQPNDANNGGEAGVSASASSSGVFDGEGGMEEAPAEDPIAAAAAGNGAHYGGGDGGGGGRRTHRRSFSAPGKWSREAVAEFSESQFMHPEWMVDVPPDLATEWYVTPRPSGQRCLVIASRGGTVSRLKTGRVLHRFPSALPGGSKNTRHGGAVQVDPGFSQLTPSLLSGIFSS